MSDSIYEREKREAAWRAGLKEGDKVLFRSGGYEPWHGGTVEKATVQHVVIGGTKYRRKDGYEANRGRFCGYQIVEPLPELVERIERSARRDTARWAIERFVKMDWRRLLEVEQLETIASAIEQAVPSDKTTSQDL